ncbi:unnamed protein product [Peniophora sp. CBMAI 1063]|nr:unnamed protein product [Peniophora sp. CBMAI 1063]
MFSSSSSTNQSRRDVDRSNHSHAPTMNGYLTAKNAGRSASLLSLPFLHPSSHRTSKREKRSSALSYSTYSSQNPDVAEMLDDDNMSWGKTPRQHRHRR